MMRNRRLIATLALALLLLFCTACSRERPEHNYKPQQGYVPNEETAIKIAIAVWEPIYGKKKIANEKPYKAILNEGVWKVEGSLPQESFTGEEILGGVAEAYISKDDGRILRVTHGK